jgi:hypothetical protein
MDFVYAEHFDTWPARRRDEVRTVQPTTRTTYVEGG